MRSYLEVHALREAAGAVWAGIGSLAGVGSSMVVEVVLLAKHLVASRDVTSKPLRLCLPTSPLLGIPPLILLLLLQAEDLGVGLDRSDNIVYGRGMELGGSSLYLGAEISSGRSVRENAWQAIDPVGQEVAGVAKGSRRGRAWPSRELLGVYRGQTEDG